MSCPNHKEFPRFISCPHIRLKADPKLNSILPKDYKCQFPIENKGKLFFADIGDLGWSLYLSAHIKWLKEAGVRQVAVMTYPDRKCLYEKRADLVLNVPSNFYTRFGKDNQHGFGLLEESDKKLRNFFASHAPAGFEIPEEFRFVCRDIFSSKVFYTPYAAKKSKYGGPKKDILIFPRYRKSEEHAYRNLPREFYVGLIKELCACPQGVSVKTVGVPSGAYVIKESEICRTNYRNLVHKNSGVQDVIDECQGALAAIGGQSALPKLSLLQGVPTFVIGHEKKTVVEDENWMGTKVVFYQVEKFGYSNLNIGECIETASRFVRENYRQYALQKDARRNTLVSLTCYNGHQRLQRSLPTLFKSKNNAKFDVYILDDGSLLPVDVDYPVILERRAKHSKNQGEIMTQLFENILKLDYNYYYLTDDDYCYSDGWLDKCVDMLRKPDMGIATAFCHPKDYERFKHSQRGAYYFPESVIGGSLFISKKDLKELYRRKKDSLRESKLSWDYNLSKSIFDIGKKVISPAYSLVQHNPWDIRGAFSREQIKGLKFQGKVENRLEVSIIILCHNELKFTKKCIESIRKHTKTPYQLVVIDNGSTDRTLEYLKAALREKDICIRNSGNRGFSESYNRGAKVADGEYVLILNNDTEALEQGWLENFLRASKGMDAAGASVCYNEPNKKEKKFDWKKKKKTDWGYIEGWCILIKKDLFLEMGGFDSKIFDTFYCEDADFSYRLTKLGKRFKEVPVAIKHYGSRTAMSEPESGKFISRNNRRLYSKHIEE